MLVVVGGMDSGAWGGREGEGCRGWQWEVPTQLDLCLGKYVAGLSDFLNLVALMGPGKPFCPAELSLLHCKEYEDSPNILGIFSSFLPSSLPFSFPLFLLSFLLPVSFLKKKWCVCGDVCVCVYQDTHVFMHIPWHKERSKEV